jgi:uncharacterized repeat protein (TIGR03803 family)
MRIQFQKIICIQLVFLLISLCKINAQCTELYGTTNEGGEYGVGTIFKTDVNGNNQSVVFNFKNEEGKCPVYTKLCESFNGKLYGMTKNGGDFDKGLIFEWDPATNAYTKKISFDGSNGKNPYGSLMQAKNGKLYGMTYFGGINGIGVLFEWDPITNLFVKKFDFDEQSGCCPTGSLIQASNGKLYGMTSAGGTNCGVIFEFDISKNSYNKKIDLGCCPTGSLIQASNGKLYGACGVIFEYNPLTNGYKHVSPAGYGDYGSLIEAYNGKLYGMSYSGGTTNEGNIFEWDPATNEATKKVDLTWVNGRHPTGSLVQAFNGKLYGMTFGGGINSMGVLFEWDPETNIYSKKIDFDGNNKGAYPGGSLLQASNGRLYGLTTDGGSGYGVLFEWNLANSTYTKKINFNASSNGSGPNGSLVQADNGKLYGMTSGGGIADKGVIFEWDPVASRYTKKMSFLGTNGANPLDGFVIGSNGKLYGETSSGGDYNCGVIFEWDPAKGTYTKLIDFNDTNGANPNGPLLEVGDGKFYGTTKYGGTSGFGVLFEWELLTNTLVKKVDINEIGIYANSSLLEADNGKLFATTCCGGVTDYSGVIYEFDPATDKAQTINEGIMNPVSDLIQASNKKIYGLTSGYPFDTISGMLFEWDLNTGEFSNILYFYGDNYDDIGLSTLIEGSNGKLYGTVSRGGTMNKGMLFEWDINSNTFTKKIDFAGSNGSRPFGSLLQISCSTDLITVDKLNNINLYPNPTKESFTIDFGEVYSAVTVTIISSDGRIIQKDDFFNKDIIDIKITAPSGVYVVSVKAENEIATYKVIKN